MLYPPSRYNLIHHFPFSSLSLTYTHSFNKGGRVDKRKLGHLCKSEKGRPFHANEPPLEPLNRSTQQQQQVNDKFTSSQDNKFKNNNMRFFFKKFNIYPVCSLSDPKAIVLRFDFFKFHYRAGRLTHSASPAGLTG